MNIEAGKSYRTRAGRKAIIYRVGANSEHSIHGVIEDTHDHISSWTIDGCWVNSEHASEHDLIAPWTDTPTMDVTVLPRWATHVNKRNGYWDFETDGIPACDVCFIPDQYAPRETVPVGSRYRIDWDNKCLVEEGGGK